MNRDKLFFRYVLLHYFDLKKSVIETHRLLQEHYGEQAPSHTTCKEWFRRFRSGHTDVHDKERSGGPKKFEDCELQALLDEDSTQTQKELANKLEISESAVSRRLRAMGKIHKE